MATLKRKIEARFFDKKVSPGHLVKKFIAELDVLLQKLHNRSGSNQSLTNKRTKNFKRLVKRLRHKTRLESTILRKSDKSKVFHLGKIDDYEKKSEEYMAKT